MKLHSFSLIAAPILGATLLMGGCAAGPVSLADKDTDGTYDGVWVGNVAGPRAKRETLPGNWSMRCGWEPFYVTLTVVDGEARLAGADVQTPVSSDGRFRIDVGGGEAGMTGGTMPGNGTHVRMFSGELSGDEPRGKYMQYITSRGQAGCNAPITFSRR